jgi:hypothetical protein
VGSRGRNKYGIAGKPSGSKEGRKTGLQYGTKHSTATKTRKLKESVWRKMCVILKENLEELGQKQGQ